MSTLFCDGCSNNVVPVIEIADGQLRGSCPNCNFTIGYLVKPERQTALYCVKVPLDDSKWFAVAECDMITSAIEVTRILLRENRAAGHRVLIERTRS